jgi:hypothetical protein
MSAREVEGIYFDRGAPRAFQHDRMGRGPAFRAETDNDTDSAHLGTVT